MTTTTYQPRTLESLLTCPCGCGAHCWVSTPPYGIIECAECGGRLNRPCGHPRPQDDGGDDDGGDGPAGAPAAAPVELAVSAARSARPFTHLSELSDSERAEYEAWAAEVKASAPDPEPCCRCNRPARPFETTPDGPLCWRFWPTPPEPDRPTVADLSAVWLDVLTELQAARQKSAEVDAVLARVRFREGVTA